MMSWEKCSFQMSQHDWIWRRRSRAKMIHFIFRSSTIPSSEIDSHNQWRLHKRQFFIIHGDENIYLFFIISFHRRAKEIGNEFDGNEDQGYKSIQRSRLLANNNVCERRNCCRCEAWAVRAHPSNLFTCACTAKIHSDKHSFIKKNLIWTKKKCV